MMIKREEKKREDKNPDGRKCQEREVNERQKRPNQTNTWLEREREVRIVTNIGIQMKSEIGKGK
jgi:hypothetical protein